MGIFSKPKRELTEETMILLDRGMKPKDVVKLFGKPPHLGNNAKALDWVSNFRNGGAIMKGLPDSVTWGYETRRGLVTLLFISGKLDKWEFHEGKAWNPNAPGVIR